MNERSRGSRHGLPAFAPAIGLREVLESSPDLVFSADPWGRLVWASTVFETITGRRVKDCVGRPISELITRSEATSVVRAYLKTRERMAGTVDRTVGITRLDGTVTLDVRWRFIESPAGERYLVGVAREAREVREVRPQAAPIAASVVVEALPANVTELQKSLAEAREVAQVKGDFLATMSHEIRTPMSGVIGMTNLLLQNELAPESRQLVELIRDSTETLLSLTNDTLDYSRLEAGRMPVETLDFDLRVTVDQIAGVLHQLAEAKSLRFDTRVGNVVPSRLKGDPGRLRQVLLNLGSNAIKFTERGSVGVRVERESEDDQHVSLMFHVNDSGPGIEPGALPRLFEPYAQSDATVSRRYGGSGLGLAISQRLIQAMGGEVGVDSRVGEGSTFWFRLRYEKQPVTVGNSPAQTGEVLLHGVRVLVADGNPGDRDPLAEVLTAWGCDVTRAENGPEALGMVRDAAAAGRAYAVALLDRHLEGLNGEELGQAIRADQSLADTRLVMITNVGRPGDGGRVKAAGFAAYLMKPLEPGQLYEALGEILRPGLASAPPDERQLVTRHSLAEARRGKLRILLVDDDPVNQLVTTSALHRVGYNVDVASNGRRAIELTGSERWDLILMDMQMPDLDGCRTTSAIRARERGTSRTPIIGLTANADHKPDRERCLASGMDLVLGKPVNLEQLTSTVEKFTSRDGRATESEPAPNAPMRLTVVSSRFDAPPEGAAVAPVASDERPPRTTFGEAAAAGLPVVPEGPALDLEQLETACMSLPALRSSLLHTFLSDMPSRMERLSQAFESGDPRRVEFEAHGLKGMCATIGANGCALLFGEMEESARDEQSLEGHILLQPVRDEVKRAEEFIRRFDAILSRAAA